MSVKQKEIDAFFDTKTIAVAGVSRNEKKFGYAVYKELKNRGYTVLPINPNTDFVNGNPCFNSVADLPADVDRLVVVTPKKLSLDVLKGAYAKGIKQVWVQQMSDTEEALNYSMAHFDNIVYRQCIMMFAKPVQGMHKFHRNIKGLFGRLPK